MTRAERSRLMARVASKHSGPELAVRRAAHRLGYRFRLHRRDLPGTPDLVFPGRRRVVFVHGCWWHRHAACGKTGETRTNRAFWREKFRRNVVRDRRAIAALTAAGWSVLVAWECGVKDGRRLEAALRRFLGPASRVGTAPRGEDGRGRRTAAGCASSRRPGGTS